MEELEWFMEENGTRDSARFRSPTGKSRFRYISAISTEGMEQMILTELQPSEEQIEKAVLALDFEGLHALLLGSDLSAEDSHRKIDTLLVPALEHLGEKWERGEIALSQLYLGGRICEKLVDSLFPIRELETAEQRPHLGIAVLEDYHLLGKRIVSSMVRSAGYTLRDYGRTTLDGLVERVVDDRIDILFVSTLMLPSALRVRDLCAALRANRRSTGWEVKVMVGGAPFRLDECLWREVNADAMGATASDALDFIRKVEEAEA
jgi:methanogenic corrinoid protein MtbC1